MTLGRLVVATGLALLLAGCATQPEPSFDGFPGFLSGIWHGFTAPLALIGSIFGDFRIYASPNSGWFYDLGFMLGLLPWGGGAAARR